MGNKIRRGEKSGCCVLVQSVAAARDCDRSQIATRSNHPVRHGILDPFLNSAMMSTGSVGLSRAHSILHEEETPLISLSADDLWRSYSLDDSILTGVKQHLIQTHWLSEQGKWDSICGEEIDGKQFAVSAEDGSEVKSFAFFSHLFNAILDYLRQRGHGTPVKRMVYAGSIESTGGTSHHPDAFLQLDTGTSPTPGKFKWKDLVCPFEYKLGDGCPLNVSQPNSITGSRPHHFQNDTNALRSLHHIMRCDPRRIFSFGVTIQGNMFRIWLLCRAAPFTFTPFDWFEVGAVLHFGCWCI